MYPALYALVAGFLAMPEVPPATVLTAEPVVDIAGFYRVQGQEREPYHGVCSVVKSGDRYIFRYLTSVGNYTGIGVRVGDAVAVALVIQKDGETYSTATLYRIEAGRLIGRWASSGAGDLWGETLFRLED